MWKGLLMGQHSLGTPNYRLSKGLIIAIVVLALLAAAVLLWSNQRLRSDEEHSAKQCIEGQLSLPIATHGMLDAEGIVEKLAQQDTIVRDFCVQPKLVDDPAQAAVLLSAETQRTIENVLARSQRSAASKQWPVIANPNVGTATRGSEESSTRYPTSPDAVASAILAYEQQGDADAAYQVLENDRGTDIEQAVQEGNAIAVSEGTQPEGWDFVAESALHMPIRAVVLNSNDAVGEEQQRAADAVVKAVEISDAAELKPEVVELLDAFGSTLQTTSRTADTLFVLDTSTGTEAWSQQAKDAMSQTVQSLTPAYNAALMNYSSPLSPGVSKGWRDNVGFDDELSITQALEQLGTGGVPQTREALQHALTVAQEHQVPTNIILITSGSSDATNNEHLDSLLSDASQGGVQVSVVHVGDTAVDTQLRDAVERAGGSFLVIKDPSELSNSVHRLAGLA